jgi:WD40 repeat protein
MMPAGTPPDRRHRAGSRTLIVALLGIAVICGVAGVLIDRQRRRAEAAEERARTHAADAITSAAQVEQARQAAANEKKRAERLLRVSTAQRLAVASQQARDSGFVPRGILLGVAAVKATTRFAEPVVPEAEQALRSAVAKMPKGTRYSVGDAVRLLVTSPEPVDIDYPFSLNADDPEAYEPRVSPPFSREPARARWLVVAACSDALSVWDLVRQPRSMQRIGHDGGSPESLALSADERWLVASFIDGTVRVWDLTGTTPKARHRFSPTKPSRALCTAISPDGRRLAAGFMSGEIRLWDLADADPANTSWVLPGHTEAVQSLQIDSQARLLASESHDKTVRVWDLTRRSAHEPLETYHVEGDSFGSNLAFSQSTRKGNLLASSNGPRLWDLSDTESADGFDLGDRIYGPVVFASFDQWLLGCGAPGALGARAWDLRDHEGKEPSSQGAPRMYRFGGEHAALIVPAMFDPDRGILHDCFLAAGRTVQAWSLPHEPDDEPRPEKEVYCGHDDDVSGLAASHDGAFLFTGGEDGAVQIWELGAASASGQAGFMVPGEFRAFAGSAPRLSADGRWLFVDRHDDSSRLGSLPPNTVLDLSQSPPREVVLDVVAETANTPPPAPRNAAEPEADRDESLIGTGRFCSHTNTLVAAVKTPGANRVLAWNLTTGGTAAPRVLIEDTGPEPLDAVLAASPDLRWLVSDEFRRISDEGTQSEGSLKLWHLAGPGPPVGRVLPTKDFVSGGSLAGEPTLIEFSPDGRWLVLAGGDVMQRLLLFDLVKSDEDPVLDLRPVDLARFAVREDRVLNVGQFTCATFSPDGRWLYVSDLADHLFRIDLSADRPQDAVVATNVAAGQISRITPSADGRWIGCCLTRNNAVAVWDAQTFAQDAQPTLLMGHEKTVDCLAFGGETRLASGSVDETVRLWDLAPLQRGGSPTCQVFAAGSGVNRVGFAANGSVLLAVTNEGVRGWPLGVDTLIADALRRVSRDLTAEERAHYGIDFELAP